MSEATQLGTEQFVREEMDKVSKCLETLENPRIICRHAQDHEHATTIFYLKGYLTALATVWSKLDQ